jgi:ankyrin repeat protein
MSDMNDFFIDMNCVVTSGDVETMKDLLGKGYQINLPYYNGTVLYHAASNGHLELCEYLLSQGADPEIHGYDTIPDSLPKTPLEVATARRHTAICELLKQYVKGGSKNKEEIFRKYKQVVDDIARVELNLSNLWEEIKTGYNMFSYMNLPPHPYKISTGEYFRIYTLRKLAVESLILSLESYKENNKLLYDSTEVLRGLSKDLKEGE